MRSGWFTPIARMRSAGRERSFVLAAVTRQPARPGQTMVLFALTAVVLVGFLGLAIDVGYYLGQRRAAQNAADAVALAAAKFRAQGQSQVAATAAALALVAPSSEHPDGFPASEIGVTYPAPNRVRAVVERDVQPFFIRALYDGDWTVQAEAVATLATDTGPFALLALAGGRSCNTPDTGIRFQGSGTVTINNGSIGSNNCIRVSGATNLSVDVNGGNAQAVNEIVYNGRAEIQVDDGYYVAGGIPPIADPLAGLTPPACQSLPRNPAAIPDPRYGGDPNYVILSPGRYTNPITYRGMSLLPGAYCFERRVTTVHRNGFIRSVDVSYPGGSLGELPGGGVVLYFTGRGELQLNGGAGAQLRAAGAAPLLGLGSTCDLLPGLNGRLCNEKIVIWIANDQPLTLNGHVENELIGTIYAPNASVTLAGTEDTPVLSGRVIARDITITGDALLNLDADPRGTADPTRIYLIR